MDVKFKFFKNDEGKIVGTLEDENIELVIVLKKDYSNVEEKFRDLHILQDIENALGTASETEEFKDLVDSYGYLYIDNLND
jgi:hypothetical protein